MGRVGTALVITLIVLVGSIGFVLVAARTLERVQSRLVEEQFDFVLSRADEAIERNLQLGLPLSELQQTQPILERATSRSPYIMAADVFSPSGTTLFSTDRGAVGEPVPEHWMMAIEQRRDDRWRALDPGHITIGQPITNDFDAVAGWAVVITDRDANAEPLSRAFMLLREAAPAIVLLAALAGVFGMILQIGSAPRPTTPQRKEPDVPLAEGALEKAYGRAMNRLNEANRVLDAAEREMQALDARV